MDEFRIRVRRGSPQSFGWLRRPEWDAGGWPGWESWERPDGGWTQLRVIYGYGRQRLPPFIEVHDVVRNRQ